MKSKILIFLAFIMLLSTVTACSSSGGETPSDQPDSETVVFTDDAGREITVPAEVTNIVSAGPIAQIYLFALCPEMLVGLSSAWEPGAEGIITEEYLDLPVIGQISGGTQQINPEELALLDPQLVIDVGQFRGSIVEDLDSLQEQTGITAAHITADIESMPDAYRKLGTLLGKETEAEEIAIFCEKVLSRTQELVEKLGDNKTDVVYCLGMEGLSVFANGSFHAEVIDMLTNNIAVVPEVSGKGTGNPIDLEQLLVWDPEYLIISPDVPKDMVNSEDWQSLSAISSGNYAFVPSAPYNWVTSPPSAQRYLSLIWLPAVLYPDMIDYDVYEECAAYFELFYHVELTRDMFDTITYNAFAD